MSTARSIVGNSSSQNIDFSQAGILGLNAATKVSVSSVVDAPTYQKNGTDADVVKLGNSFTGGTSTIVGLLQPVSYSATGFTTMYGYNNLSNSTNGGGACIIYGSRNLLSATSTSVGMIVMGDRNYQTLVSGNNNMAVGTFNGNVLTTGANNIFLGGFTAQTLTTGSNNYTMGFGCSTPALCDHSITFGNSAAGEANQFTFGSGTNFLRFLSGCTTNTVDLGSAIRAWKTLYLGTSILGPSTQSIAFSGSDTLVNGGKFNMQCLPVSNKTPFGVLLSTPPTGAQANAYTVASPTRLITMTSGPGNITANLFTIGATGVMTYTGLVPIHARITMSYSYMNAANSPAVITHWISVNGSLTLPTNTTATESRTFVNALTTFYMPASINTILLLNPSDTLQLVGNIAPAANLTVNYRSICYTVNYVMTNL